MDFSLFFLAFALFWKRSSCLRCFQCVPELTYSTDQNTCGNFDGSEKYYVHCYNSSMCYKRETVMEFGDGVTTRSFHRGCAPQTEEGHQKKVNGKWRPSYDIHDAYDEDCKVDAAYPDRVTRTLHCYCRGDLCNGASTFQSLSTLLFIFTICLLLT